MKLKLRRIGNSYGVILPKKVLPYDLVKQGWVDIVITDGYKLADNDVNVITNTKNIAKNKEDVITYESEPDPRTEDSDA
jgi:hypothetical protein